MKTPKKIMNNKDNTTDKLIEEPIVKEVQPKEQYSQMIKTQTRINNFSRDISKQLVEINILDNQSSDKVNNDKNKKV